VAPGPMTRRPNYRDLRHFATQRLPTRFTCEWQAKLNASQDWGNVSSRSLSQRGPEPLGLAPADRHANRSERPCRMLTTVSPMTAAARKLNALFLAEMTNSEADSVLGRVRDVWWSAFVDTFISEGAAAALDQADVYMLGRKAEFLKVARDYASSKVASDSSDYVVRLNQFVKSNIGKMFEKFAGLSLAYALYEADAPYCVLPFRAEHLRRIPGKTRQSFRVGFDFGDGSLFTHIDADAFVFCPTDSDAAIYFLSMKSTLKDRFHNVPFWNLLRRAAISADFPEIIAADPDALARLRYVAVCSDFAEEQPDFGTDAGARNLLKVDASMLDGAYVTSSRAKGLPADCKDHLGDVRQHAFYRYSCLYHHLVRTQ